mgnify:CR=1 FL=1
MSTAAGRHFELSVEDSAGNSKINSSSISRRIILCAPMRVYGADSVEIGIGIWNDSSESSLKVESNVPTDAATVDGGALRCIVDSR